MPARLPVIPAANDGHGLAVVSERRQRLDGGRSKQGRRWWAGGATTAALRGAGAAWRGAVRIDDPRRAALVDHPRRALLVDDVRVVGGGSRSSGEKPASDDAASDQSVIVARISGGGRQRGGDQCRDKQLFHDGSFPSRSGTIPAFGRLPAHAPPQTTGMSGDHGQLRLLALAVLQIGVDRRPGLSAPANLLLFDAIRVCLVAESARHRSCAVCASDGRLMRRSDIFPATADDGAVSDGRRAFTRRELPGSSFLGSCLRPPIGC